MTPQRIQRKRTKGWRMPEGAVYVGRPSKWGNPCDTADQYRYQMFTGPSAKWNKEIVRRALRGKDLACWCSLDEPGHADVLLEIANAAS